MRPYSLSHVNDSSLVDDGCCFATAKCSISTIEPQTADDDCLKGLLSALDHAPDVVEEEESTSIGLVCEEEDDHSNVNLDQSYTQQEQQERSQQQEEQAFSEQADENQNFESGPPTSTEAEPEEENYDNGKNNNDDDEEDPDEYEGEYVSAPLLDDTVLPPPTLQLNELAAMGLSVAPTMTAAPEEPLQSTPVDECAGSILAEDDSASVIAEAAVESVKTVVEDEPLPAPVVVSSKEAKVIPAYAETAWPSRMVVCARIRPQLQAPSLSLLSTSADSSDLSASHLSRDCIWVEEDGKTVTLSKSVVAASATPRKARLPRPKAGGGEDILQFPFDRAFGPSSSNDDVAEFVMPLAMSALDGYNATVLAFGQTASGKTYTIDGITQRVVQGLFDGMKSLNDREFLLRLSVLEVYNEEVMDLLNPVRTRLVLMEDAAGHTIIQDLTVKAVEGISDARDWLAKGSRQRHVSATMMNRHSSRSHCLFRFHLESSAASGDTRSSVLTLVDLAGSERLSKTGADGAILADSKDINRSLLALSNCINKMSEAAEKGVAPKHIPYRTSKLTRILSSVLGGNSRTAIICNVASDVKQAEESILTLRFAQRAACIKTHAGVNVLMDETSQLRAARNEIQLLKTLVESSSAESRMLMAHTDDNDMDRSRAIHSVEKMHKDLADREEKLNHALHEREQEQAILRENLQRKIDALSKIIVNHCTTSKNAGGENIIDEEEEFSTNTPIKMTIPATISSNGKRKHKPHRRQTWSPAIDDEIDCTSTERHCKSPRLEALQQELHGVLEKKKAQLLLACETSSNSSTIQKSVKPVTDSTTSSATNKLDSDAPAQSSQALELVSTMAFSEEAEVQVDKRDRKAKFISFLVRLNHDTEEGLSGRVERLMLRCKEHNVEASEVLRDTIDGKVISDIRVRVDMKALLQKDLGINNTSTISASTMSSDATVPTGDLHDSHDNLILANGSIVPSSTSTSTNEQREETPSLNSAIPREVARTTDSAHSNGIAALDKENLPLNSTNIVAPARLPTMTKGPELGQTSSTSSNNLIDTNRVDSIAAATSTKITVNSLVTEGELFVRKGKFRKRWERRHASVISSQTEGRVLMIYSAKQGSRARVFPLAGSTCVASGVVTVGSIHAFGFVLRTASNETLKFGAFTQPARELWVSHLQTYNAPISEQFPGTLRAFEKVFGTH